MQAGWLTPDSLPTALRSCVVSFPDSEEFHSLVRGALFLLSEEKNWEEFGSLTVSQTADAFRDMLVRFFGDDCMQIPVGTVLEFAGASLPSGFLWADGALVSRTTYSSLFATIGVSFGAGNGTTTFQLPDRRGKVGVGRQAADTDFNPLGKAGGVKNHTLTVSEIPAHRHDYYYSLGGAVNAHGMVATATSQIISPGSFLGNTGGGGSHNNMQPYLSMNYIIKF